MTILKQVATIILVGSFIFWFWYLVLSWVFGVNIKG